MSSTNSSSSSHPQPRHRFVRLNPRFDRDKTLELLKSELQQQQLHQVGINDRGCDCNNIAAAHIDDDTEQEYYPLPVPWLNSKQHKVEFFAVPSHFSLNKSQCFQSGRVYGMDVTSGAAVAVLLFDIYDVDNRNNNVIAISDNDDSAAAAVEGSPLRVLDLCCAPG